MHNILLKDVGDDALANVDASGGLAARMLVAKLGDGRDRVEASVFGQCVRDDL